VIGERNPKEIEWLKKKYISKIETIEKAKNFPTKTGILCKWCEYLTVCADGKAWMKNNDKNFEEEEVVPAPPTTAPPAADDSMTEATVAASGMPSTAVVFGSSVPSGRKKTKPVSADQLSLF